jgi:hypothetical protein
LFIGPADFVFCKADGSPLNPDVLRKDVLYPTLDQLQISRYPRASGFHAFRHSAASLVNRETGNLKMAQRLLGHADMATTADTYTHTWTEDERRAAVAIERAILDESGSWISFGNKKGTWNFANLEIGNTSNEERFLS